MYNLFIQFLDQNFAESGSQFTYGKSICPKGSLYTRYFIKPDYWTTQTTTTLAEVKLSIDKATTTNTFGKIMIKITAWPMKLFTNLDDGNGYVEIGALPDVKKGHAFDFRIACEKDTFDIYFNDIKFHSFSDIHSNTDYDPLIVTKIEVTETGSDITDVHHTYSKLTLPNVYMYC
jgi:hypothetical protein